MYTQTHIYTQTHKGHLLECPIGYDPASPTITVSQWTVQESSICLVLEAECLSCFSVYVRIPKK